jgi:hypothetical protein
MPRKAYLKKHYSSDKLKLIPRVNTDWLNRVYQSFANDVGISETKKVLLVEDNAYGA